MATAVAYTKAGGKKEAAAKLEPRVFGVEPSHDLLGLAYRAYLANGRSAGAQTLTRGMVRGGGKKPWRQKGTGRARAGSSRIPHWTGGCVAFGPTGQENYTVNLPTKVKRAAIRQALSLQAKDKKLVIIDNFDSADGRVKPVITLLDKLKFDGQVVLVVADKSDLIDRATRNIVGLEVVAATYINVFTLLNADWIVMTTDAQKAVEVWLGEAKAAVLPKPEKPAEAKPAAKASAKPAAQKPAAKAGGAK